MRKHNTLRVGKLYGRGKRQTRDGFMVPDRTNMPQQLAHGIANDRTYQYVANRALCAVLDHTVSTITPVEARYAAEQTERLNRRAA